QQTLDLALEVNADFANFYSAMAYPGSHLYRTALEKGLRLPMEWHHYSQHAYDTTPLPNEHLSSAEILRFRDHAFQTYFSHGPYLEMVRGRFGPGTVEHIHRMSAVPLPRRLLEDGPTSPVRAPRPARAGVSWGR